MSVVAVTRDRLAELEALIRALDAQREDGWELIVVLNGASPEVLALAGTMAESRSTLTLLSCSERRPGAARNLGVSAARGELIWFIDDDAEPDSGGLATLRRLARRRPEADVIGGPNLTHPQDGRFGQLSGLALGSRWGTGQMHRRYAAGVARDATERDLICCNLAFRRRVFDGGLRFPEDVFPGEENALLVSAARAGHQMRYEPELVVHHRRRPTLRTFLRQVRNFGRGRAQAIRAVTPRALASTCPPVCLVPVAFLTYLLALPLLSLAGPLAWAPLVLYAAGTVIASLWLSRNQAAPLQAAAALLVVFPALHIGYATGLGAELLSPTRRDGR